MASGRALCFAGNRTAARPSCLEGSDEILNLFFPPYDKSLHYLVLRDHFQGSNYRQTGRAEQVNGRVVLWINLKYLPQWKRIRARLSQQHSQSFGNARGPAIKAPAGAGSRLPAGVPHGALPLPTNTRSSTDPAKMPGSKCRLRSSLARLFSLRTLNNMQNRMLPTAKTKVNSRQPFWAIPSTLL